MKKELRLFSMLLLTVIIFTAGCKKDDDTLPAINVGFKYAPENPIAGEEITFTNASNGGSTYLWDFGDGNTSTEQNPVHIYEASNDYTVTLTVDNREDAVATKTVTVQDQVPEIASSIDPIEIGVEVTFTGSIYNPDGETVTYAWEFPVGKVIGEGVDATTGAATGETVTLKFTEAEEADGHAIKLTATIGGKDYVATKKFVVKNQLAKTVFFAAKGGNLWMKKIYANGVAQVIDMGIASGLHSFTLDFANDRLYVFDAGEFIGYSASEETTPGSITSMSYDGTEYKTHITFDGHAYDDAFFGCVTSEKIYWTDRNWDVTAIDVSSENIEFITESYTSNPDNVPAFVVNNLLGHYGHNYGWGALNGTFAIYDGMYWWAKNSNHSGIHKFVDSDIQTSYPAAGYTTEQIPTSGSILNDYYVRAFVIDEVNQKIYFSSNKVNIGLYVADIDGSNVTLIDDSPADGEGGADELSFITGIDIDNESGYVYWAYRGPALDGDGNPIDYEANPTWKSGIKRYKLDGSGEVEYFVEDVEAYGLTIDHTKR